MKAYHDVPVSLFVRDQQTSPPPGGGLALVIAGSFLFWAILLWAVL